MADKKWDICKDILLILCILFILYTAAATIIPHIKSSTAVEVSFNAAKLTESGQVADTMPITIEGSLNAYSSGNKELKVNISSFDGFTDFVPRDTDSGKVHDLSVRNCQMATYYACKDGRTYYVILYFSKDFDYWMLIIDGWDRFAGDENSLGVSQRYAYYAGSTNESATLEDICRYFSIETLATGQENDAE